MNASETFADECLEMCVCSINDSPCFSALIANRIYICTDQELRIFL